MTVLSHQTISKRMLKKELIIGGVNNNIGSAYYELRMGKVYYDLTEGNLRIELRHGEKVIIKPGHRVVLITQEELNIPDDIYGRVISKGSLFSIGLSAVCTNADPGFKGNLGLVTQNFSDKYIEIPQNEGLAKIDFSLLDQSSNKSYRGQHGFQLKIWPIKKQLQKEHKDFSHNPRVETEEIEGLRVLPKVISASLIKIKSQQKKINVGLVFFLFLNLGMLVSVSTSLLDPVIAFTVNMISSLLLWLYVNITK
jgi:dCTP deaminase